MKVGKQVIATAGFTPYESSDGNTYLLDEWSRLYTQNGHKVFCEVHPRTQLHRRFMRIAGERTPIIDCMNCMRDD